MRSARLLVLISSVTAVACGAERDLGWGVHFESEPLAMNAERIELEVRTGSCAAPGAPVYVATLAPATEDLGERPLLSPGHYAFSGRAADAMCTWIATGFTDVELPTDEPRVVVELVAVETPIAACAEGEVCQAHATCSGIDFRGDWETGDTTQWTTIVADPSGTPADQLAIVTTPVRQGAYAARFTVLMGGGSTEKGTKERSMVEWRSNETEGDDFWYAWSTMFPADWAEPSGWGDIVRWTSALSYPPALRFNARADTLLVNMTSGDVESGAPYRNEIVALPSLSLGSWHDFVVHVSWTAEPSGVVAMWHRTEGETELRRVVCLTAIPTLHRASTGMVPPHYVRQGLARDQTAFVSTVYQDGFRRGTSWAAVTEELGAPPEPSASCP